MAVLGNIYEDKFVSTWYVLSDNRAYSAHVVYHDKSRENSSMILVDSDDYANVEALKAGMDVHFVRNATPQEAEDFLVREQITVKKVVTV